MSWLRLSIYFCTSNQVSFTSESDVGSKQRLSLIAGYVGVVGVTLGVVGVDGIIRLVGMIISGM